MDEDVTLSWPGSMTTAQAEKYLMTGGFVAVELYRAARQQQKAGAPASTNKQSTPLPCDDCGKKGCCCEGCRGYISFSK